MTYVEKTSYLEIAPHVHNIAYKNNDNLLEMISLFPNLFI